MNDDELKKLWQQQPLRNPPSAAGLIPAMQKQTSQLRRCLKARDIRELVACAVVVIIFGVFYFTVYREPISRIGNLIVIGSTIFIAWKIIHTRRTTPPAPPGATTVESLRAELKSVRAQSRLLRSVLWWYLLPGFIGVVVATWGLRIDVYSKIGCTVFFIAVDVFIYWLNRWARSNQLVPLEAQLESLLHSAETGEPPDETRIANLRPIALSMAAADQVKPVEFKVAFWQIALFGEIGFIGIWFFVMLGLAIDHQRKTKEQSPETFAQTVRVEETNRYAAVARKVIDLLNAGDYAAVERLYNPVMSAAFPPPKASEFFTGLAAQFGKIEKFDGPTGDGYQGWLAFRLHCQRGELTMSLALDAEDKIAGLHFRRTPRPLNIGAVASRIFSWQHLAWIVPFFLAGLLYSRIIQKTTERAVGISLLGIHLRKGQNLILWDEIKEVRPLRILHIRNLWLIRESGEKTLMHWTPLERHSDLKAAVEKFGPVNHPIRRYLSLLKRI
jgi:hypothetical protein